MFKSGITYSLISMLLYGQLAYADCSKPVTFLPNGTPAPCDGFLFTPEKERELRLINEDNKYLKQESELKDKLIDNYRTQVDTLDKIAEKERQKSELWQNRAETITEKYVAEENNRGFRDWLFLIGGVVLTVGAGYAVGQASK
jgi:hypothetical protein